MVEEEEVEGKRATDGRERKELEGLREVDGRGKGGGGSAEY